MTACPGGRLDGDEITALTRAMVGVGERLTWPSGPVVDKHCVGGLPGNRTTPIVVAIVTACGLTMPKTSSRAITSPAGTADTMETLAPVDLSLAKMRRVVEREGGCVVWGGAVRLSPADDVLIRVERAIDLDGEGQLVASVLSKKAAAGSTHLVLDLPVGPTAKLRSLDEARRVGSHLERTAPDGGGDAVAEAVLRDGRAKRKFERICEGQGGMHTPPTAQHCAPVGAQSSGRVRAIDNRRLARIAKLAGAPDAKAAGLTLFVRIGDAVEKGQPLFTVHAETRGELSHALDYERAHDSIIDMEET